MGDCREDPVHRRCIASSLVNVVYLLETNENQAKEFWYLLQFEVKQTVIDDHDNSIYGTVFQWRGRMKARPGGPPSEVVAFRGHSLGAAIALGIAMNLQRDARHILEAHLFNPPFICPTVPQLKVIEKSRSCSALNKHEPRAKEARSDFSRWLQPICVVMWKYFEYSAIP
ncbi:uncharacterized protein LOC131863302, partial [Cryptomeria japonica]|uniref:uncharacterized protein LOC131863302 n=1 Tax=Cryptomeria japonica TaxID=3369 RepID=UPI0027DA646D